MLGFAKFNMEGAWEERGIIFVLSHDDVGFILQNVHWLNVPVVAKPPLFHLLFPRTSSSAAVATFSSALTLTTTSGLRPPC